MGADTTALLPSARSGGSRRGRLHQQNGMRCLSDAGLLVSLSRSGLGKDQLAYQGQLRPVCLQKPPGSLHGGTCPPIDRHGPAVHFVNVGEYLPHDVLQTFWLQAARWAWGMRLGLGFEWLKKLYESTRNLIEEWEG